MRRSLKLTVISMTIGYGRWRKQENIKPRTQTCGPRQSFPTYACVVSEILTSCCVLRNINSISLCAVWCCSVSQRPGTPALNQLRCYSYSPATIFNFVLYLSISRLRFFCRYRSRQWTSEWTKTQRIRKTTRRRRRTNARTVPHLLHHPFHFLQFYSPDFSKLDVIIYF